MKKVKLVFYENYGSKAIKTIHNVIPTSISMNARNRAGRKELYVAYDIQDEIRHHGCFTLAEGIIFSIFSE